MSLGKTTRGERRALAWVLILLAAACALAWAWRAAPLRGPGG